MGCCSSKNNKTLKPILFSDSKVITNRISDAKIIGNRSSETILIVNRGSVIGSGSNKATLSTEKNDNPFQKASFSENLAPYFIGINEMDSFDLITNSTKIFEIKMEYDQMKATYFMNHSLFSQLEISNSKITENEFIQIIILFASHYKFRIPNNSIIRQIYKEMKLNKAEAEIGWEDILQFIKDLMFQICIANFSEMNKRDILHGYFIVFAINDQTKEELITFLKCIKEKKEKLNNKEIILEGLKESAKFSLEDIRIVRKTIKDNLDLDLLEGIESIFYDHIVPFFNYKQIAEITWGSIKMHIISIVDEIIEKVKRKLE